MLECHQQRRMRIIRVMTDVVNGSQKVWPRPSLPQASLAQRLLETSGTSSWGHGPLS